MPTVTETSASNKTSASYYIKLLICILFMFFFNKIVPSWGGITETGVAAIIRAIESKKKRAFIPWWPWAALARLFPILPASVIRLLT